MTDDEKEYFPCDKRGCTKLAEFNVVLLLRPKGCVTPARGQTGIHVCADHREKLPDPFITEEGWKQILASFDARKLQRPHRILTDVAYDPINAPHLKRVQ